MIATAYKGISFDDIHSYKNLNLVLSSVDIPPAMAKTNYIDIVGGDGSLDLTEVHGEVKYNDRDCKFTFTMHPSDDLTDEGFEKKKTEVSNVLNGMQCKIILDKDSDYYYIGRCTVNEYLSDKRIRQIVVNAKVRPYKFKVEETVVEEELTSEFQSLTLSNGRKSVVPKITCSDDNVNIEFNGNSYIFNAGTHTNLDIQLVYGENIVKVKGEGTIEFRYREGDL
jgi:hypothetical protein